MVVCFSVLALHPVVAAKGTRALMTLEDWMDEWMDINMLIFPNKEIM